MQRKKAKHAAQQKNRKRARTVWIVILCIILALGVIGSVTLHRILRRPESLFELAAVLGEPKTTAASAAAQEGREQSAPTPTPPDVGQQAQPVSSDTADLPREPVSLQSNIVNVMLMGIDAFQDGASTSGTMPHTDVCMVVSINFDTNDVSLISLARDLFTTTPGYYGYYKLNGVFNVGGGIADPAGGCEQVCRTAEQWLGGISIPYYYAVDFQAVIDIVDAIGGIDYYSEIPLYSLVRQGEKPVFLGAGDLHMNGEMVLAYLRGRTMVSDGLDSSRTARQRKMMVAIFHKLKTEGTLSQIPSLLSAVKRGVYTNTSLSQTAALANFAVNIKEENIHTLSIHGPVSYIYDWEFSFVDQSARMDTIREVYGIDAEPVGYCTLDFEDWLHRTGFPAIKRLRNAEKLLSFAEERLRSERGLEDTLRPLIEECRAAHDALDEPYREASAVVLSACASASLSEEDTKPLREEYRVRLEPFMDASQKATQALASACGYPYYLTWWGANIDWVHDPDINEIDVDFR